MAAAYKSYWNPAQAGAFKAEAPAALDGGSAFIGKTAKLSEGESRHLVKVFRARQGEPITLFDAAGSVWRGTLALADARAALVQIESWVSIPAPRPQITLGQAMPKGKTMDSVIAAMVELGVTRIVPLATDHSEVRLEKDAARAAAKCEHWQQTAIEAAKQSANFYGTRVGPITSLQAFLGHLPTSVAAAPQLRIIGSLEEGSVPLAALASEIAAAAEVVCLIGPEGDFSVAEYALARECGFRPVRLAAHVLRVHTAATYIASTVDALATAARCLK